MKEEFTLSVKFCKGGCARLLFSDGNKQKLVNFVNEPSHQYYTVGWFIDAGLSLLNNGRGSGSLYTEYATIPSFVAFEGNINSDGNLELKIEEAGVEESSVVFVTSINQYVEQALKLFDDNVHKFSINDRMATECYGTKGKIEELRCLFHAKLGVNYSCNTGFVLGSEKTDEPRDSCPFNRSPEENRDNLSAWCEWQKLDRWLKG